MTQPTKPSSPLMDVEAGGEQTQYEGATVFAGTREKGKEGGVFNVEIDASPAEPTEAAESARRERRERGEKTAENVRYGEAVSEHGFGGETVGNGGGANQGKGWGGAGDDGAGKIDGEGEDSEEKGEQTRRAQGYGGGSGVGG